MRQSYAREIKELKLTQRFRGKAHSKKKVAKADRRMCTIAGRFVRELLRELPSDSIYREHLELCLKFVNGELIDGHKIYSLHEPDVLCISKGKEHELFRKRAGIEPLIGHCKNDHRLGRNYYKGLFGDSINVMLAAAAFNLKRVMRALLRLIRRWIQLLESVFGRAEPESRSLVCVCVRGF